LVQPYVSNGFEEDICSSVGFNLTVADLDNGCWSIGAEWLLVGMDECGDVILLE
jgi:hypothetical protein